MSEGKNGDGNTDPKNQPEPSNPETPPKEPETPPKKEETTVSYQALKEEREKRQALQEKLDAMEAEKKSAAQKQAEEEGKFKELYESTKTELEAKDGEIKSLTEKMASYEESIQEGIKTAASQIKSEEDRELFMDSLKGKNPAEQQALVPRLLQKFGTKANINPSASGSSPSKTATDEEKANLLKQKEEAVSKNDTSKILAIDAKLKQLKA